MILFMLRGHKFLKSMMKITHNLESKPSYLDAYVKIYEHKVHIFVVFYELLIYVVVIFKAVQLFESISFFFFFFKWTETESLYFHKHNKTSTNYLRSSWNIGSLQSHHLISNLISI